MTTERTQPEFDPKTITRPDPALKTYYIIISVLTVVAWPILLPIQLFKYHTLRYAFDDKGVSMAWGALFRREIYLTYRRIQDIHVTRNIIHRKLGLADVAVQTASGSAGAEMTIEGIRNPEKLRDFLYSQMRGAKDDGTDDWPATESTPESGTSPADEALLLLREIRDEVQRLRAAHDGDPS